MVQCGELCKGCGNTCSKDYADGRIKIECVVCDGRGMIGSVVCKDCEGGHFVLSECPRQTIGQELTEAINLAGMCGKGDWPVAGGLLDQSAWFIDLKQMLERERTQIENSKKEE